MAGCRNREFIFQYNLENGSAASRMIEGMESVIYGEMCAWDWEPGGNFSSWGGGGVECECQKQASLLPSQVGFSHFLP